MIKYNLDFILINIENSYKPPLKKGLIVFKLILSNQKRARDEITFNGNQPGVFEFTNRIGSPTTHIEYLKGVI